MKSEAIGQGKTMVAAGIARTFVQQGKRVRVFKAGPDFIDPFWLTNASDAPVYQLDTWMVGEEGCRTISWCNIDWRHDGVARRRTLQRRCALDGKSRLWPRYGCYTRKTFGTGDVWSALGNNAKARLHCSTSIAASWIGATIRCAIGGITAKAWKIFARYSHWYSTGCGLLLFVPSESWSIVRHGSRVGIFFTLPRRSTAEYRQRLFTGRLPRAVFISSWKKRIT